MLSLGLWVYIRTTRSTSDADVMMQRKKRRVEHQSVFNVPSLYLPVEGDMRHEKLSSPSQYQSEAHRITFQYYDPIIMHRSSRSERPSSHPFSQQIDHRQCSSARSHSRGDGGDGAGRVRDRLRQNSQYHSVALISIPGRDVLQRPY